ncbi:MAG TPA: YceI family protein [Vicinamibacterales bacterium]
MRPRFLITGNAAAVLVMLAFAGAPTLALAADVTWLADPGHSIAQFSVRHLGFTKVNGSILIGQAKIVAPEGSNMPTSIAATLPAASIDTRNPDRDSDLKGPDWLDVGKYPTITFVSTKVVPGDNGNFQIAGDLTIHGVTKPVTFSAHLDGTSVDGRGHHRASYSAMTTIDRRDYGLLWANTTPGGSIIAGNDVEIDLEIEAVAQ